MAVAAGGSGELVGGGEGRSTEEPREADGEIEMARAAEATIVFTQDWHPESTPHFAKDGGPWPIHCVADTWGAKLHPGVDAEAATSAPRVRKGANGEDGYSG